MQEFGRKSIYEEKDGEVQVEGLENNWTVIDRPNALCASALLFQIAALTSPAANNKPQNKKSLFRRVYT